MQLNETTPLALPPHHAPTSLKTLLLIFGVLVVAALGYLVWAQNSDPDATDYSATSVKKPETKAAADETASWKTYTNTKYSFIFKYPADWKLTEDTTEPSANLPEQNADGVVSVEKQASDSYLLAGEAAINVHRYPSAKAAEFDKWFDAYKKIKEGDAKIGEEVVSSYKNVKVALIDFLNGKGKLQTFETTIQQEGSPSRYAQLYFVMDNAVWALTFSTPTPDSQMHEATVFNNLYKSLEEI